MEAAGEIRVNIEAKLSRPPSTPFVRRHGGNRWHENGISVASGNYVAAKVSTFSASELLPFWLLSLWQCVLLH